MEKYNVTYNGKEYAVREVDLSPILDGYGVERIGSHELSAAIDEDGFTKEGTEVDNTIYCYLDSGVIESDVTDAEILLAIIRMEGEEQTDQQWYNLMRMAGLEIALMHESGRINVNCEGYECGGRYSVYAYNGKANHSLYEGKSAKQAAIAMVNALTMIRLMRM